MWRTARRAFRRRSRALNVERRTSRKWRKPVPSAPHNSMGDGPNRTASTPTTVSRLKLVITRREGRYGAGTARLRVRSGRRAEKADTGRAKQVYPFARADAPRRPIRDGQSAFTRSLGPTRREGRYGSGKARLRVSSGRRADKADAGRALFVRVIFNELRAIGTTCATHFVASMRYDFFKLAAVFAIGFFASMLYDFS